MEISYNYKQTFIKSFITGLILNIKLSFINTSTTTII